MAGGRKCQYFDHISTTQPPFSLIVGSYPSLNGPPTYVPAHEEIFFLKFEMYFCYDHISVGSYPSLNGPPTYVPAHEEIFFLKFEMYFCYDHINIQWAHH